MKMICYLNLVAALALFINIGHTQPKPQIIAPVVEEVKSELIPAIPVETIKLPDDQWAQLIVKYFGPEHVDAAVKVSKCENGARTADRISLPNHDKWKSRDYGLFQLNDHWQDYRVAGDVEQFLDPETNIRVASEIFRDSGDSWALWSCRNAAR